MSQQLEFRTMQRRESDNSRLTGTCECGAAGRLYALDEQRLCSKCYGIEEMKIAKNVEVREPRRG